MEVTINHHSISLKKTRKRTCGLRVMTLKGTYEGKRVLPLAEMTRLMTHCNTVSGLEEGLTQWAWLTKMFWSLLSKWNLGLRSLHGQFNFLFSKYSILCLFFSLTLHFKLQTLSDFMLALLESPKEHTLLASLQSVSESGAILLLENMTTVTLLYNNTMS